MSSDNKNNDLPDNNKNKTFGGADKLLNQIQLEFGQDIKPLMTEFFGILDDLIFQIAENSKSNIKKNLYFDSLKSIRVHKLNVLSSFLNSINQTFQQFQNKKFDYVDDAITKINEKQTTFLSTLDENDITEKLAQNSIIHQYEKQYVNQLSAFNKRFSFLIGSELSPYHIPVGPYVIVSAFAKSIRLLHLDINLKLILYKNFETSVMSQLKDIYKNINSYLNKNGIVTGLENNIINHSVELPKIQTLTTGPKKTEKLNPDSLILELNDLQSKISEDISDSSELALSPTEVEKALLVQIMQNEKITHFYLEQTDKDTFNLVTLLFQLIYENVNIPKTIQTIIAKIQIPYLKAALLDKNLISNKKHPAQNLLHLISKSSVGWSNKLDVNNSFINELKKTTEAIVLAHNLDKIIFQDLYSDFQVFMNQMKSSFSDVQERINEKSKGKEKIIAAMTTVEALLNLKIENNSIPDEIKVILLGPWKSLLVLLLVRHSNSSEEYLLMVNFIDELLNLLESHQNEINIRNNIEKLASEYEYGLKLVAYNGKELNKKIEDFKLCLLKQHTLKEPSEINEIPQEFSSNNIITKIHNRVADVFVKRSESSKKKKLVNILEGLNDKDKALLTPIKPGVWIDFKHKNGKLIRTQLSWISPKTKNLIFVNNRGLKITNKSPNELAEDLYNKRAILV